ncbi:hypothetical protein [Kribbella endophytica]
MEGREWLFGLVDGDSGLRLAALERQAGLVEEWSEGLRRSNALWFQNGQSSDFSRSLRKASLYEQALADQEDAIEQTVYSVAGDFGSACWYSDRDETEFAPYAVLFLRWEAEFPEEWRAGAPWSPWGLKQRILRGFVKVGPLGRERELTDLLMGAVGRPQRCEDRLYSALARHLDGPELRSRLAEAEASGDQVVRLRAGYVGAVLDDRSMAVSLASWKRWVAAAEVAPGPEGYDGHASIR